MRFLLAIFLLTCGAAEAQIPPRMMVKLEALARKPSAAAFNPTNVGSPYACWIASAAIPDETGKVTNWPSSYGNFTLANYNSHTYLSNNFLNGQPVISVIDSSSSTLRNNTYSVSQPHEIWLVASRTTNALPYPALFGGNTANELAFMEGRTADIYMDAGTQLSLGKTDWVLNKKWAVLTFIFDGTKSRFLTNNVVRASGNAGTTGMSGIGLLGAYAQPSDTCSMAEIITYTATNSVVNQSNIFWYLTNKYNIAP